MNTEAQEIPHYFEELRVRLNTVDRVKKEVDRLIAPDFNPFALLRPDELRLSNVIAALLNPVDEHGQGARFLSAFIELLEEVTNAHEHLVKIKQSWGQNLSPPVKVGVEIPTHLITDSLRRMDILVSSEVSSEKFGLMIENKPWAWDQPGQLASYHEHLSKDFPLGHVMVYLSGNGAPPSDNSFSETVNKGNLLRQGNLIVIGYRPHLTKWLSRCIYLTEAVRVRVVLTDLLNWIETNFEMNESDREEENKA